MNWRPQRGRELVQRRSLSIHVHTPDYLDRKGINPFSGPDIKNLVEDSEQLAKIISMGDYTLMVIKTSVTPSRPSQRILQELTLGIAEEYTAPGANMWKSMRDAIKANKEMCLALGLMYYLGKTGGPVRRVPLIAK